MFSKEELEDLIFKSNYLFLNEYEAKLLESKLKTQLKIYLNISILLLLPLELMVQKYTKTMMKFVKQLEQKKLLTHWMW